MKKLTIYATLGLVLVIGSVYAASTVSAEGFGYGGNVSDETREEHMAERTAERAEAVLQAIEEEKVTERQAEILNAMEEIRLEGGIGMFGAGKELTAQEREALRAERRATQEGSMLEALNEVLENPVTEEELQELREKREELGLMGNQSRKGRGMDGQGTGECANL